jgi:hypothetical protein
MFSLCMSVSIIMTIDFYKMETILLNKIDQYRLVCNKEKDCPCV